MEVETYDKRNNSPLDEAVDQIRVELNACLVDGVIAASKRNNAGPGDGEAIG